MPEPTPERPIFPPGYLLNPQRFVAWSQVEARLAAAKNFWLGTTRPGGRPHTVPLWGAWLQGRFYFDGSPETRHARNIAANPHCGLHLESGDDVVILEGTARAVAPPPPADLARQIAAEYGRKYAALGYTPDPDQWDNGGLFEFTPHTALAWTVFTEDPTRFTFG